MTSHDLGLVGLGALLGRRRSAKKAAAAPLSADASSAPEGQTRLFPRKRDQRVVSSQEDEMFGFCHAEQQPAERIAVSLWQVRCDQNVLVAHGQDDRPGRSHPVAKAPRRDRQLAEPKAVVRQLVAHSARLVSQERSRARAVFIRRRLRSRLPVTGALRQPFSDWSASCSSPSGATTTAPASTMSGPDR